MRDRWCACVLHTDSALKKACFFEPLFTGAERGEKKKGCAATAHVGAQADRMQASARIAGGYSGSEYAVGSETGAPPAGRTSEAEGRSD